MGIKRLVYRRAAPLFCPIILATSLEQRKNSVSVLKSVLSSTLHQNLRKKSLERRFSPPSAITRGGICERLVRSFRRVLYTIIGTCCLMDAVWNATLWQILSKFTGVFSQNCQSVWLRHNNTLIFLNGNQAIVIPLIIEFDLCSYYARALSYSNAIWSPWLKEYILALSRRSKWQTLAEQNRFFSSDSQFPLPFW